MKRAIGLLLLFIACIAGFLTVKGIFPFLPIFGSSMEPALQSGSLLTIKAVKPENIKVGDIIIYNVPATVREYYNYPPVISRRVIEITTAPSLAFRTKGDSAGDDPFTISPINIRGTVGMQIPYLGLTLLLFQNQERLIYVIIALVLLAVLLYNREILRGSAKIRRRAFAPAINEEKRGSRAPAHKIEAVEKNMDTAEQPRPQPQKAIKKTAKPFLAALNKSVPPKEVRKHGELTEEALAAEKEIFGALDNLHSKLNKPKGQE